MRLECRVSETQQRCRYDIALGDRTQNISSSLVQNALVRCNSVQPTLIWSKPDPVHHFNPVQTKLIQVNLKTIRSSTCLSQRVYQYVRHQPKMLLIMSEVLDNLPRLPDSYRRHSIESFAYTFSATGTKTQDKIPNSTLLELSGTEGSNRYNQSYIKDSRTTGQIVANFKYSITRTLAYKTQPNPVQKPAPFTY